MILLYQWQYGTWHSGWGGGWWWGLPLVSALLLIAAVGIFLSVLLHQGRIRPGNNGTARQILAERFARGEIDEAAYRSRIAQLSEHGAA